MMKSWNSSRQRRKPEWYTVMGPNGRNPSARHVGQAIPELTMPSSFGAHLPGLAGAC